MSANHPHLPLFLGIVLTGLLAPLPVLAQEDDPDEPAAVTRPADPAPSRTETATKAPAAPAASPSPEAPPPDPSAGEPEAPPNGKLPELSWSMLTADVPESGGLIEGSVGFASLPRVGYHLSLGSGFSIGAVGGFDYALFSPTAVFDPAFYVAGVFRMSTRLDEEVRLGLRGELGALVAQNRGAALVIDLSANVGFSLGRDLIVGPGIDVPIAIGFRVASLSWPVLIGGVAEYRLTPPLSVTLEAKIGPSFNAPGNVTFSARVLGGIAIRL